MGFFSDYLFSSPSHKYSDTEHFLSELEITKLVSEYKIKSLTHGEENLVEQTIIARRLGDGKISLRQIYEALSKLKVSNKISKYDREALMKLFQVYYDTHKN